MKTIKLYDIDAYATNFEAEVADCRKADQGFLVELDRTLFFPEEGGQSPDKGILGGQEVLDVQIDKEGTITHLVGQEMPVGKKVSGSIDWKHRFSNMQQHSGEHIISGLVNKYYQYNNVGFHLGPDEVTLDFDGTLTPGQLRAIEAEANQAVKKNFPVHISFPDADTLAGLNYRSKIELKGAVRIVEFPGYDICACCAPHVRQTGEIGLIKVTGIQSHRGGVRVNILCGDRAIADYTRK